MDTELEKKDSRRLILNGAEAEKWTVMALIVRQGQNYRESALNLQGLPVLKEEKETRESEFFFWSFATIDEI